MMHGVLDQTIAFVAPTPRGTLDFVNSIYNFDGSTFTLSDVVNLTGRRSSSGLSIIGGSPALLQGAPLTFVLAANWTVVFEFEVTDTTSGYSELLMTIWDAGLNNQIAVYGATFPEGTYGNCYEDPGTSTRGAFGFNPVLSGVNKLAATRDTAHVATALAGEPVVVNSSVSVNITDWTNYPPTQAQLADSDQTGVTKGYIKSIAFYDPVIDAKLASLSA